MLEKPAIEDAILLACLQAEYGILAESIAFLPLGADLNTAVYRVDAAGDAVYFLKLRSGEFLEASVTVPKHLHDLGLKQVIAPIPTRSGSLCANLPSCRMILYPFITGRHGFDRNLTEPQWVEFGAAMRMFHTTPFPPDITRGIPRESFTPQWRESVQRSLSIVQEETLTEPVAREMAAFLKPKTALLNELVNRTGGLAGRLQKQAGDFILCHGDIHAWNLLMTDGGAFYMVDWDTLIFAPKERDLMFIGGGLMGKWRAPADEEALFYRGYGSSRIDPLALAYYRYERVIEDIAIFCDQVFSATTGGEDRRQAFEYLKSYFIPGSALEIALLQDPTGTRL